MLKGSDGNGSGGDGKAAFVIRDIEAGHDDHDSGSLRSKRDPTGYDVAGESVAPGKSGISGHKRDGLGLNVESGPTATLLRRAGSGGGLEGKLGESFVDHERRGGRDNHGDQ
jgi:hypothetical protein